MAVKHPKGLYVLFFSEMWERFGFYLMLAIFTLYLTEYYGMTTAEASGVYGNYMGLVYLSPLVGGVLADRVLGYRRSVMLGALLLGAGAGLVSINGQCVADTNIDGTPQSPQGPGLVCPDIYKTTAPGSGLIGVAIAGVLTGTVLLAIPGEKRVLRE